MCTSSNSSVRRMHSTLIYQNDQTQLHGLTVSWQSALSLSPSLNTQAMCWCLCLCRDVWVCSDVQGSVVLPFSVCVWETEHDSFSELININVWAHNMCMCTSVWGAVGVWKVLSECVGMRSFKVWLCKVVSRARLIPFSQRGLWDFVLHVEMALRGQG